MSGAFVDSASGKDAGTLGRYQVRSLLISATRFRNQPDQPALAAFLAKCGVADPDHFPDLSLSIIKLIGSGEYVVQRAGRGRRRAFRFGGQ